MRTWIITYTTKLGSICKADIEAYMEYTATERFKNQYAGKYRAIISVKLAY